MLIKFGVKPASQQNQEQLIKAISIMKAMGKCEKWANIIAIVSDGFICHSPAIGGMAGEDKSEMDGATKADHALSQT